MAVPNNNSFTLDDVVQAINPSVESLEGCFADADSDGFDPSYEGDKDRLSNFRNYHHVFEDTFVCDKFGSIDRSAASLSAIHNSNVGDSIDESGDLPVYLEVEDVGGGAVSVLVHRIYIEFDLSDIPSTADIMSAYLEMRIVDEYGSNPNILVKSADFGSTLDEYDLNKFGTTTIFDNESFYDDQNGNEIRKMTAPSSGRSYIEQAFGEELQICLIHNFDYNEFEPNPYYKQGYTFWASGEVMTGDFQKPQITVKYKN